MGLASVDTPLLDAMARASHDEYEHSGDRPYVAVSPGCFEQVSAEADAMLLAVEKMRAELGMPSKHIQPPPTHMMFGYQIVVVDDLDGPDTWELRHA